MFVEMAAQIIREKFQNTLLKELKLSEDKPYVNTYTADKASILVETRRFTQSTLKPKECCETLVKILYMIVKGEELTPHESSDLFFSITRLFQSSDQRLRRMVYLVVKSLEVRETEVFILTSSLTKDMNSNNDCYRANAMRVLSKIIDTSMATQIERFLKTAVVDKNPFVASSALLCGMHLWETAPDVVKRWVNEVTESINSKNPMVQFHAIALLHEMKLTDRLALQKIISNLLKGNLKSPFSECLVIRYTVDLLLTDRNSSLQKNWLEYLERCLRHKSEMVMLEAAKALCNLSVALNQEGGNGFVFGRDILPATTILQTFLTSFKSVLRFAAMRQLNLLANTCPAAVVRYNADLEALLNDANRNIASLALTTLLKTGHESNIDRLIKQIASFMNDVSDTFKQDILKAVKALCLAYPSKHRLLMSVLSTSLREEGNFEFKSETVDAIITLVTMIPDALETGIMYLCDFIEDCEYPSLCMLILSFLGECVPTTTSPSKFIRFIYNRLILENAHVRAAAVDALIKIALKCPELRRDILFLLESCTVDNDDEVRDRTNLFYNAIDHSLKKDTDKDSDGTASTGVPSIDDFLDTDVPVSLDALCDQLGEHIITKEDVLFDISNTPSEEAVQNLAMEAAGAQASAAVAMSNAPSSCLPPSTTLAGSFLSQVDKNENIYKSVAQVISASELGELLLSNKLVLLTESEAEYSVLVQKHIFAQHMILEFIVTNTLSDQILENITVNLSGTAMWTTLKCIPIKCLVYESPQSCFVILKRNGPMNLKRLSDSFEVTLRYVVKDTDGGAGFDDQYGVDQVTLSVTDYITPLFLNSGEFKLRWESYQNPAFEQVAKFSLHFKTLAAAVEGITNSLNMSACDRSDVIDVSKPLHSLLLSGLFLNEIEVLCMASLFISVELGCVLKFTCRCRNPEICSAIINSFE